ncbi:MAG: cysteine--tRNA ligase [Sulfitobacter sp.]|jgi:cysteinyl-tRNA synthetase
MTRDLTIKLHNTATRKKEDFTPIDAQNVRMYVCGPTVYDRAHLGNARPVIVFDVLYRLLRHVYGPEHVTYVRNFTDVDDKINARAADSGRSIGEITAETTQWYLDDMAAVGALEPDHMPRATQYIPQMVAMIRGLIDEGYAYEAEGHVLFRVRKYAKYGALSGRSVDDMIAGARVEVAPYKEDPMDFVLWKPSNEGTPGWPSPWGQGRPGWHIECSAMAHDFLGAQFDIHGGGIDLQFPHHENEIAQSKCAGHGFANYWLHNEMLQVEGKKMSKSLGNFFTVRDLLEQGVQGEVIRFVMLSTHYRKPMDWTASKAKIAYHTINQWFEITEGLQPTSKDDFIPDSNFLAILGNDLNTHGALTFVRSLKKEPQKLLDHARFLGFLSDERRALFAEFRANSAFGSGTTPQLSRLGRDLDALRKTAMVSKDFGEVDRWKRLLSQAGVIVKMTKNEVNLSPGETYEQASVDKIDKSISGGGSKSE